MIVINTYSAVDPECCTAELARPDQQWHEGCWVNSQRLTDLGLAPQGSTHVRDSGAGQSPWLGKSWAQEEKLLLLFYQVQMTFPSNCLPNTSLPACKVVLL